MTTLNETRAQMQAHAEHKAREQEQIVELARCIVMNADQLARAQMRMLILNDRIETILERVEQAESSDLTLPAAQVLHQDLVKSLALHAQLASVLSVMVSDAEIEAFLAAQPCCECCEAPVVSLGTVFAPTVSRAA